MNHLPPQIAEPRSARLHPMLYKAIIALILWLIFAIWGFAAGGYAGITLVVVTLFLLAALGLMTVLWRISRRNHDSGLDAPGTRKSLGAWLHGEMEVWEDRVQGTAAATQVILPIAAAAVGMTVLAIILHFDVGT